MAAVAYTVTATLPNEAMAEAYVAWLREGHIEDVVAGGAERAEIVRIVEPGNAIRVQTRYWFPDSLAYETYLAEHAPRLRAEGMERFGPETGVRFERSVGEVVGEHPE